MRLALPALLALFAVACTPAPDRSESPPAPSAPRLEAVFGSDSAGDYTHARARAALSFQPIMGHTTTFAMSGGISPGISMPRAASGSGSS